MRISLWVVLAGLVVCAPISYAADRIIGTTAGSGIMEELTPEDAADVIGSTSGASGLDANFDLTGGNIITGISEAKKVQFLDSGGTNGVVFYWHSSGKLVIKCVVDAVEGDCNVAVELNSGKSWSVTNSDGTSTYFKVDQTTGKVGKMTVDAEDPSVSITLYQRICGGDVVGVDPVSGQAGHIYERSALDTVTTATAVAGTNQTYGVARFPDVDGDYGLLLKCTMPPGWTGLINVIAWGKTTGTGNFRMQLATKCYSSNESPDAAFNTAVPYTLSAGTSNQLVRYFMTNPSMVGCASDEVLFVRAFRNRLEGLDTLNDVFDLARIEVWARNTY